MFFSRLAPLLICFRVGGGRVRPWLGQQSLAVHSAAAFSLGSWEPEKVLLSPGLIHCTIFCAAVILTGGANLNFCNPQPQTPPTPETVCVAFFSKGFSAALLRKSFHPKKGREGGEKKTSVWLCPGDCFYSCRILKSGEKKVIFPSQTTHIFHFLYPPLWWTSFPAPPFFQPLLKKKIKERGKINPRNQLKLDLELHNDLKFSQDLYFGKELFYEWI